MTSILSSYSCNWPGVQENRFKSRVDNVKYVGCSGLHFPFGGSVFDGQFLVLGGYRERPRLHRPVFSSAVDDGIEPDDSEDKSREEESPKNEIGRANNELFRENLERIVGTDDSTFSGIDLATLIRNKYGRSYDVQLIKKRSFPLTEEEYLLRLDDIANTLKCWGAVSHIRNSLAKSKERPRIGKAVSIFIDMDETGGRANEWIYK
ncbi:PREDICTED: uncharacterized protein LOC104611793 isoform X2 [Nelumbo nucifera]|uniref:Uncharacterized protein LOC104611793 isoform X2 n=1 Tax=Nelumbo nucifera TaxID=4432 RepID=A0A1U8BBY4_NELNU|nr:PREDICTED: uncharacterized protein LOC104611793 isoform X2 [Nelumbo nucifera]